MSKKNKTATTDNNNRTIASNKRARHEYAIGETFECGIILTGGEIKSVRSGNVSLKEAYASVSGDELWLYKLHIAEYNFAHSMPVEVTRKRKLLAHLREIRKMGHASREKSVTLVPLELYLKNGWAKVLIGIATGKKLHDKRRDIAERDSKRQIARAMRQ